jgi:hypothetical protein
MGEPDTTTRYVAHFQPLAGCVRVFQPGKGFGDPYVWSCTALCQGDTVELLGALEAPTNAVRRAVQDLLVEMGFRRLRITRIKNGVHRSAVRTISRHDCGTA